jgi:hypothetical protein
MPRATSSETFEAWLEALEARHLENLRVPEVTRALRALSSAYVERRRTVAAGATLNSAGKRAAFALFYGPLHYLTTEQVLRALGGAPARVSSIVDLGCGTGAAGAAWAASREPRMRILGIDRHPWAVAEARWTYHQFGLDGHARVGDLTRLPPTRDTSGVLAAYVLNELAEPVRLQVEAALIRAGEEGASVLVLEPVARRVTPWWDTTAARVIAAGGRADEWRFRVERPPLVQLLDRAAGLDHRELTARSLSMNIAT